MKLCLERVEEMRVSLSAVIGRRPAASQFISAFYLFRCRAATPNPPAVPSALTVRNAISKLSVLICF